jgi:uncharacterized phage infection (PIP) family protein YhgE
MANSRSPIVSPAAADSMLRRKLREATTPAQPPAPALDGPDPAATGGEFDSGLAWNAVASPALSELDPLAVAEGQPAKIRKSGPIPNPFANPAYGGHAFPASGSAVEMDKLKLENEELHKLVEEMKQIFAQASEQEANNTKTIESLKTKIGELEQASAGKDEQLAMLTGQIHELEVHIQQAAPPPPPPNEDELSKMADELEKERCQLTQDRKTLDTERQQVRDDEEDMMRQMREMEVQMARERAEMARQRTELQRLHSEVKRELDLLQGSDRALTDRLAQFQRRHQDLLHRAGMATTHAAAAPAQAAGPEGDAEKKESGLFSRIFGRK